MASMNPDEKPLVALGLSGGKDSTCAALLLQNSGYRVVGVHMNLGLKTDPLFQEKLTLLADRLGIPLIHIPLQETFRDQVISPFVQAYRLGLTPNPCVHCNRLFKFGILMDRAIEATGASFFATGHYADRELRDGAWVLREHQDGKKSQTYFLAAMDPSRLHRVLFPLSDVRIEDVRRISAELPLPHREESQDICFLNGGCVRDFLFAHIPEAHMPGPIMDPCGTVVGQHQGALGYTRGQRRGLGHAGGSRLYVLRTRPDRNEVFIGPRESLMSRHILLQDLVVWQPLPPPQQLSLRVRYHMEAIPLANLNPDGSRWLLETRDPVFAPTPGQLGVIYDGPRVVAAGTLTEIPPPPGRCDG